ncbi:transcriptional regulator FilR1 domain-containing protein [Halorussus gelatinilyticus]|uniref:transcriptional regulator FilR1 domain-containing protein n=1 Tax=Halorussus gelatinilyticus TaxID=2937524 RepID=UPI003F5D7CF6
MVSSYREQLAEIVAQRDVSVREASAEIPFALLLVRRNNRSRVAVLLQSDDGVTALLTARHRLALDWAERTYERYRRRSRDLSRISE